MLSKNWDEYTKTYSDGSPNPNWAKRKNAVYGGKNAVYEGTPSKTNVIMDNYSSDDIDHVVAIIGWNDDINAWRIKNSWGKDWGDDGLMNLAYGYNNIGFNAAWVTVRNIQKVLPNAVLMGLEAINRGIAM